MASLGRLVPAVGWSALLPPPAPPTHARSSSSGMDPQSLGSISQGQSGSGEALEGRAAGRAQPTFPLPRCTHQSEPRFKGWGPLLRSHPSVGGASRS